ncbi:MAG: restriction endonuclease [Casimicrobiaceae bacterium]
MNFAMRKNSLFAILLRSPWWMSLVVAAIIAMAARLMLPDAYVIYGVAGAIPFLVIACISGWRALRSPSTRRVAETLETVRGMTWPVFADRIEAGYRAQGYVVKRLKGGAADFELERDGRTALVACKRWKVARTGLEPVRDLHAAGEARDAHECLYVTAGEMTENALAFAAAHRMRLLTGVELARLVGS